MSATTVHPASHDADTVAPEVVAAAAKFTELAHCAMQRADDLIRLDELSDADEDLAAFAIFVADVIRGDDLGMDVDDVVAAFRAIGRTKGES